ncbi:MAG TPA: hypothetical protein VL595_11700 [Pseudonocardia sp.]|jgi:hypothetical protein|nr:hypothetical protein [Pseudonocardia sp.]
MAAGREDVIDAELRQEPEGSQQRSVSFGNLQPRFVITRRAGHDVGLLRPARRLGGAVLVVVTERGEGLLVAGETARVAGRAGEACDSVIQYQQA